MNDSTFEAIMVGVNTTIFMIALTAGMKLMGTINDMVEYSNQAAEIVSGGNLIETYGGIEERLYSGVEVYDVYNQCDADGKLGDIQVRVNLTGKGTGQSISTYGELGLKNLNKQFTLEYITEKLIQFKIIKEYKEG